MTTATPGPRPRRPDRRHGGRDRPPRRRTAIRRPTGCTRWSATTWRSTAPARRAASGSGRSWASSPTPASPATTSARCRAPPRSSSATTSRLVHDDIEDGDTERRHRPTLWTIHGIPQAINTGDTLFSLSRIALHRLTDLGFPRPKVLRLMRLYDETCLALCEGQYLDIEMSRLGRAHDGRALLRHDRAQDGGPDRRFDRGRGAPGDRRRGGHRALPRLWLGARASPSSSTTTSSASGARSRPTGKEPSDVAHRKKTLPVIYAYEHAGPEDRARLAALYAEPRPDGGRGRRDHHDPRARRRPRVHARPGPPLSRRGARRARRRRRRRARARARLEEIIVSVISA